MKIRVISGGKGRELRAESSGTASLQRMLFNTTECALNLKGRGACRRAAMITPSLNDAMGEKNNLR